MRTIVLDSGAFIAAEQRSRVLATILTEAAEQNRTIVVPATVLAEIWRSPARPNAVALLKNTDEIVPLDAKRALAAGALLGASLTTQVVDATVAGLALEYQPSLVLTSDVGDIEALVKAAGGTCRIGIDRPAPIVIARI